MRTTFLAIAVLCGCLIRSSLVTASALNCTASDRDLGGVVAPVAMPLVIDVTTGGQLVLRFIDPAMTSWYYGWDAPF